MKLLAVAAGAVLLLANGVLGLPAAARHSVPGSSPLSLRQLAMRNLAFANGLALGHNLSALRSGSYAPPAQAATATETASATATAVPVPTNAGPDPVTVLNNSANVYSALQTTWFSLITDGEQVNYEKLHISSTGKATCKGPSEFFHTTGSDTLEGTAQSRKANFYAIQKGNKYYRKAGTKGAKWKKATATQAAAFGTFTTDNPLFCQSANSGSGSSGSGSGPTTSNLVNLGSATYQGHATWHLQAQQISDQCDGQTVTCTLDYYVGQNPPIPWGISITIDDTQHSVTLKQTQNLSKPGVKVSIPTPKIGSTSPAHP